jgi:hypothetical protein
VFLRAGRDLKTLYGGARAQLPLLLNWIGRGEP